MLQASDIQKIQHVIIIMQENRSFDNYFGTFPGADGIPMTNGTPTVCVHDPVRGSCVKPYHEVRDQTPGGPHNEGQAVADVNGGKMDGFLNQAVPGCQGIRTAKCVVNDVSGRNVMGYHTAGEIPNYWNYAHDFALDDHMFEPVKSWSLPDHLSMVSGWAAKCTSSSPSSCVSDPAGSYSEPQFNSAVSAAMAGQSINIHLAWTDLTWLLNRYGVSWAYYVQTGTQPDCTNNGATTCPPVSQSAQTPGIWNPLPLFDDVHQDNQLSNIQPLDSYLSAASSGTLPAVSWITPSDQDSEHPPSSIHQGQAYVTSLINAAMEGPEWSSTAIFLSWDDWGGFYDNAVPPTVDQNGYGLRVPAITISPYAKQGYIDNQTLSSDAYLKFIEDDFLSGARLDPATDGRPDPRPDVRENASILGNMLGDFDFTQQPRAPVLLPTNPPSDSPQLGAYWQKTGPCDGCTTPPPQS